MHPSEFCIFLRYLANHPSVVPGVVLRVLWHGMGVVWRRIRRVRRCPTPRLRQPDAGRLHLQLLPAVKPELAGANADVSARLHEIPLAQSSIPASPTIDWLASFDDIEDSLALNRFLWLLSELAANSSAVHADWALALMMDWVGMVGERREHAAWEPYSVSERLSNWPFILRICDSICPLPTETVSLLADSMRVQLDFLRFNLERHGGMTNNHILNNARGMYIGATLLDDASAQEHARNLFREWVPQLFDDDGMTREGSSHYQGVLSHRLEQVHLLASHLGDNPFADWIGEWSRRIRNAFSLFHVVDDDGTWSMPLIGDISPDVTPEWLAPGGSAGWAAIRSSFVWRTRGEDCAQSRIIAPRPANRFLRCEEQEAVLFVRSPELPGGAGHQHFDAGSFVLFWRGEQIVCDPGRRGYHSRDSQGMLAASHSSFLVEGLGVFCESVRLNLLRAYRDQTGEVALSGGGGKPYSIHLTLNGFRRLPDPVTWYRSFGFDKEGLRIEDRLESRLPHHVELRFILPPGMDVRGRGSLFELVSRRGTLRLELPVGEAFENSIVERFEICTAYGRTAAGTLIRLPGVVNGGIGLTSWIRWS